MDFVSVTNFFGGRTYFLTLVMLIIGMIRLFHGQLDPTYITFMGAVGSLAVVKSAAEDYHERNKPTNDGPK